jgi:hypothetical protein
LGISIVVVYIPATLQVWKNTALKVLAYTLFKFILSWVLITVYNFAFRQMCGVGLGFIMFSLINCGLVQALIFKKLCRES